ncbi:MAG: ankyrin repeat domain-containing protein [Vicinamibacterales bacterium]
MTRNFRRIALGAAALFITLTVAASSEAAARRVALIDAVKNGNMSTVKTLLSQKVDVNATEPDGTTALHWAAHIGNTPIADLLLKAGANVKATTRAGATPFALACNKGNAGVIELLLAKGADPNAVVTGEPVLMMAARSGNADAVKALLAKGANVNVAEPERKQTALMWAASEGATPVVKVLLEAGANVHARSKAPKPGMPGGRIPRVNDPIGLRAHRDPTWSPNTNGLEFTPIMWAAREGHIDTAKALLDAGANVNDEKPGDGTTVLLLAVINRHYELASMLLDRGADPNKGPGYTALQQLVWTRRLNAKFGPLNPEPTGTVDSLTLAKKMIDKGVKVNFQATKSFGDGYRNRFNRVGATAFLQAAKVADVPMMKLLIANGADPNIKNADEDTPLMVAAGVAILNPLEDAGTEEERLASVKYLVEELKIPVTAVNKNGETALHGACYSGTNSVAGYLLDHGATANLDQANVLGWKPIQVCDGQFFAGFFKAQPQTAVFLREYYAKIGRVAPEKPKVNDTSLLTVGAKFKVGEIVRIEGAGYVPAIEAEVKANVAGLVKVVAVDAQSQITDTEPYVPGK